MNDRPGPNRCGTVARIVWPDGTLTRNCDPGALSGGHVTLTRWTAGAASAGTSIVNVSPGAQPSGIDARALRPSGICTVIALPA